MSTQCCCKPTIDFNDFLWANGSVESNAGCIPRVRTELTFADKRGAAAVRWAIGRDRFIVPPGLYAVGNPGRSSNVVVTANYKLTFDHVRQALQATDTWLLILDTHGINVWCAAGKGTFGTEELIKRINETDLIEAIDHKRIIVPQLGASGVCGRTVTAETGFTVTFGPVRITDIKPFLDSSMKATPEMRRVRFSFIDRLVLVPVELVLAGKYITPVILSLLAIASLTSHWLNPDVLSVAVRGSAALLIGWGTGSILGPLALPVLPGRSFSLKGAVAGVITSALFWGAMHDSASTLELTAWACLITSIASFITMNFTGTSTYTSPSGVRKEMKMFVPCQLAACAAGLICMIATLIKLF